MKKFCQSQRTIRQRELRRQRSMNRRFNDPLIIFIERKYAGIFNEFVELYNRMEAECPNRKNLVNSKTFRNWLTENPLGELPLKKQSSATTPILIPQLQLEQVVVPSKTPCMDIITRAIQETVEIPQELPDQETAEATLSLGVDNMIQGTAETPQEIQALEIAEGPLDIDSIINELQVDQDLQALFERTGANTTEDEGIELNVYDELEMDIKPFDYNLEVEPFAF